MIKQLVSKDVEDYIKDNPKSVLLDVRTEEARMHKGKEPVTDCACFCTVLS